MTSGSPTPFPFLTGSGEKSRVQHLVNGLGCGSALALKPAVREAWGRGGGTQITKECILLLIRVYGYLLRPLSHHLEG